MVPMSSTHVQSPGFSEWAPTSLMSALCSRTEPDPAGPGETTPALIAGPRPNLIGPAGPD